MSEVLKSQLQNFFGDHVSFNSKSCIPSIESPSHQYLSSSVEASSENTPLNGISESLSQKISHPNFSLSASAILVSTQESRSNERSQSTATLAISRGESVSTPLKTSFLPEKASHHKDMKTLVLDLDETLIHTSVTPLPNPDHFIEISQGVKLYVLERPFLAEFLECMSKIYELVVYTAAEKEYAVAALDKIDPNKHISHILHREHCTKTGTGELSKDLSLIGRELKHVVFIDNLEENFRRQKNNGLKITDFFTDKSDDELNDLIPFLDYVSELDDIRPIRQVYHDFTFRGIRKVGNSKKERQLEIEVSQTGLEEKKASSAEELNQENKNYLFFTPNAKNKSEDCLDSSQLNITEKTGTQTHMAETQAVNEENIAPIKDSITYTRENKSNDLIENTTKSTQTSQNPTQKIEKFAALDDIYARINLLEQKLKSKVDDSTPVQSIKDIDDDGARKRSIIPALFNYK